MRLLSVEISGFRGFNQKHTFDLDADAVVVVGANGQGKTSLFDAILWALSGRIPRLHNDNARLVSMYSETGQTRVKLGLKDPDTSGQFIVTRSFDGKDERVTLQTPEGSYKGPSAEGKLIDLVWPDAASASDPREALASVLTRSVYLQQDLIRQFVEAATNQDRFEAVSELVGAGRVTELQASLERAKKAWSTSSNQRYEELRQKRERLTAVEGRLSELTSRAAKTSLPITSEAWGKWWQSLIAIGLKVVQVEWESREAPLAINNAIKQLEALRLSTERRFQALHTFQAEFIGLAHRPIPEIQKLHEKVMVFREQLEDLKRVVTQEQERLAEVRRLQSALKEKTEQLKTLAVLALKHLEERCPVCAQTYDKEATRMRLEALAKGGISDVQTASEPEKLNEFLAALAAKEKEVAAAELALRSGEQAVNARQMAQENLTKRLGELGVIANDDAGRNAALANASAEADALIQRVAELKRAGESLAFGLAQSADVATANELRREAEILWREYADREKEIIARDKTGEQAQDVIKALREAASAVVEERLRDIAPLLQSLYARIDPHPAFRFVTFLSRVVRGKGQLSTLLNDPIEEKECEDPVAVLSSSQVNALAICVFLALNISVPKPPLSVTILDDPLQSLDDINLLTLVDLLRQTKDRRQLCVSTHDSRFGGLLSRKLRPKNEKGRTILIELSGWSRQGPVVSTEEIMRDPVALRLVAS